MLTLFLYLNDVEEGGGTHFPLLDITVQPKKGSALLWPSVVDDDIEKKDFRTDHEALPVLQVSVCYGLASFSIFIVCTYFILLQCRNDKGNQVWSQCL